MRLDFIDRRILSELDINSRQPDKKIAKRLNINHGTIRYRINRLKKEGVIENFITLINPSCFGKTVFKIYIRLADVTDESWNKIKEYSIKHKNVFWITRYDGNWDIIIAYWARDAYEFSVYYKEFLKKFNEYIQDKQITNQIEVPFFHRKYLANDKGQIKCNWGGIIKDIKIDRTDEGILRIISTNARLTSIEIAKKAGVSERIVRYRIKELVKKGVILAFTIQLNQSKFGYDYYKVIFYLKNFDDKKEKRFIEFCKEQGNILYYIKTLGPWELELEIESKDHKSLSKILYNIRSEFGEVIKNFETNRIIDEFKGEYNIMQ